MNTIGENHLEVKIVRTCIIYSNPPNVPIHDSCAVFESRREKQVQISGDELLLCALRAPRLAQRTSLVCGLHLLNEAMIND